MTSEGHSGSRHGAKPVTLVQLALGMAVFGSATPASKIVTSAMPVFVGSGLRVGLGALALLPLVLRDWHQVKQLSRTDWLITGLIALFGMFGFSVFMLYGMKMVSGVTGAVVMSTAPAVTAAASMLFMRDAPTWRKIVAIVLAVLGVLVLQLGSTDGGGANGSEGNGWFGAGLILAAVCCEAAYTLLGKKISENCDPILVAFLASGLSLPLFLPFALWQLSDFSWSDVGTRSWIAVVWYGAGTLALGTWLWYSGVAKVKGSVAAGFMGIMPASALVLSYIVLQESFAWIHLIGFGIVFVGVLIISWEHARAAQT